MCTQIVSCLTNFEEGEEDAVEEAEEGELEEEGGDSEEIDLVLKLSADLDKRNCKKGKPKNCQQHQEERREQEKVKKDISEFYGHSWRGIGG